MCVHMIQHVWWKVVVLLWIGGGIFMAGRRARKGGKKKNLSYISYQQHSHAPLPADHPITGRYDMIMTGSRVFTQQQYIR